MNLLLGGTGRLGRAILRHDPTFYAPPRAQVDLRNNAALSSLFSRSRPSVVLHVAAWTDVDAAQRDRAGAFAVNAVATGRLASLCAAWDVPLVYVSTDHVFDGRMRRSYAEGDRVCPVNAYGASKAEGERRILASGARAAIVRTSWLYGPDGHDFAGWVRTQSVEGNVPIVVDECGRPTDVDFLAVRLLALVRNACKGPWQTWHVAGPDVRTRWQWACQIAHPSRLKPVCSKSLSRPAPRPPHAVLDPALFERWLAFHVGEGCV